ncbi:MAG: hypothetical protein F6K31_31265, partial [Symploca sp. SIO2G7]|nr:hypothetical protein [Symploca sp. SIO2G7]
MFILATLRQYARITRKSGSLLKHVVVIEEAHNIVGTDAKGAAEEGASNPKAEATKYIVRMLAEMRALGQGIIIADQLPSTVSSEVIKNTNVKLAHRTVSGDDREILQQSMLLTGTQSEELARANPGDAYLFMEGTYKSVRIKEPNTKLIYGIEEPPSNEELVECIRDKGFYQQAIAVKISLYQQKVNQQVVIVKDRLETLSQNCLNLTSSGKQLLEISSLNEGNLEKLARFSEQLGEFSQGLTEFLDSTSTEVDTIWQIARQQGIYNAIKSELIVQDAQTKLQTNQQQLGQIKSQCTAKINDLKNQINEIANLLYQEAIIQLNDSSERYQQSIESKNNHWQVVAGVSSDTDIESFQEFYTQSQQEILIQEELIHKKLISTNANQFASYSVREHYNQCKNRVTFLKNKINDIKHNLKIIKNQRVRLRECFIIVQETFSDYSDKANQLIVSIDQNISLTNVELAYNKIQDIRNQFDTALDEFDQLETDNAIQLAYKLNEEIEKMVNDIDSIQENINETYQFKYLQFKDNNV